MAIAIGTNAGFVSTAPTADPAGTNAGADTYAHAIRVTAPAGTNVVTEMGWWCDTASEEANYDIGIYSHDAANDTPEDLLAHAVVAKGTTAGWKVATGFNLSLTQGTTYWLAIALADTSTTTNINYTSLTGEKHDRNTASTLASNWGTTSGTNTNITGIYALYEASEGGVEEQGIGCGGFCGVDDKAVDIGVAE